MANQEILNRKDVLTGFHTREGLTEYLNSRLTTVYNRPSSLSVIMLDLDNFKGINDKYGHLVGDDALRFFSMIINTAPKGQHFVARYGGDEFVIVLPDNESCKESLEISKRVSTLLQKDKFVTPTGEVKINTSIGIGNYPRDAKTARELIEAADQALYYAKKHGKNRIIPSSSMREVSKRDKYLSALKIILLVTAIILSVASFMTTGSLRGIVDYINGIEYYGRYELNRFSTGRNFAQIELKSGKTMKGWIISETKDGILFNVVKPVFNAFSVSIMTSIKPVKIPQERIKSVIKSIQ